MPHEFAKSAFRFGHGGLVNEYKINNHTTMSFDQLFKVRSGVDFEWGQYFGNYAQPSKKIEPFMAESLNDMPIDKPPGINKNSLALRNLKRGKQTKLCSGQTLSKKMKIKALSSHELAEYQPELKHGDLHKKTPMWYYMLAESAIKEGGKKLGPVAARIICEVIIGIIKHDRCSFMNQKHWKPVVKTMDEMIDYTLSNYNFSSK